MADDVKWSWERALRKSTLWIRARDVFVPSKVQKAVAEGLSADLRGVQVVDEQTLIVSLTAPGPSSRLFSPIRFDRALVLLLAVDKAGAEMLIQPWVHDFQASSLPFFNPPSARSAVVRLGTS